MEEETPTEETKTLQDYTPPQSSKIIPIIIVIVLIAVVVAVYFLFIRNLGSLSRSTTSTTIRSNAITSYSGPVLVNITAVNLQWYYNGPNNVSGYTCGGAQFQPYPTYTYYYYYTPFRWGGGVSGGGTAPGFLPYYTNTIKNFSFAMIFYSGRYCNLTVTNISVTTPGFKLVNTVPLLPSTVQPNSSEQVLFTINSPTHNFKGPLSINFYESAYASR